MPKRVLLIISLALCGGCKAGGAALSFLSNVPAASEPATATTTEAESPKFSFRRAMQLVGFSPDAPEASPSLLPNELVQLGTAVNTLATHASQLNAEDPAHVTVQKARSIMDSIRPFDSALAAAKSLGFVNDATAQPLQLLVQQLRVHTQQLLQFGSQPEAIAAIQQLGRQLMNSYSAVTKMFAGGSAAYNALMGSASRTRS
jgi:hypothetical protein